VRDNEEKRMNTKRTVFSLLIIAILFSSVAMIPMSSAKRDTKVELIGTPWSEAGWSKD
jgi:hypothetical protein